MIGAAQEPQELDLKKIGASDMAAIVGLNPWRTSWDVWARIVHGRDSFGGGAERMAWGHLLEPIVAQEWVERYDREGRDNWRRGESMAFDAWPWLRCTCDYVDPVRGWVLEVKTTAERNKWQWGAEGSPDVPDYYEAQVQTYLHATEYEVGHMACLFGGQELRRFVVHRDREVGEILFDEAARFWRDHVLTERPPPADSSDACRDHFSRRRPTSKETRPATRAEAEIIDQLRETKTQLGELSDRRRRLEAEIFEALGSDYGVECDAGRVTAPVRKGREVIDWKAIRGALAELVDQDKLRRLISKHTRTTEESRSLRTTWAA